MLVPDQEQDVRLRDILEGHGPAMRALHPSHGLHPVDLAVPGAAVEIIGPDREAHELLEQIELFVGAAAGNQSAEGLGAMRLLDPVRLARPHNSSASSQVVCTSVPFRLINGCVIRLGMARRVEAEESAGAEVAVVASGAVGAVHFDQILVLGLDRDLAAVAAISRRPCRRVSASRDGIHTSRAGW